jgi:Bacterial low temperature requirement A protein (LtrA)
VSELNTADESQDARIERHASWAELFFDLVVLAGVAALAHVLGLKLDAAALGLDALLFLAFWLSWTTFMLYGNVAAGQTTSIGAPATMIRPGGCCRNLSGLENARERSCARHRRPRWLG